MHFPSILPGKWLGPSAACRAIEAAWEAAEDGVKVPVEVHVLQANGSVPVLHVARCGINEGRWRKGRVEGEG